MKRLGTAILMMGALLVTAHAWGAEPQTKADASAKPAPPKHGVAVLVPTKGNQVEGTILFSSDDSGTHISGTITGLTPGKHGFHIHEFGDLRSGDGESAGGHFNPDDEKHGSPDDPSHHAGDLGNIEADERGTADVDLRIRGLKLHFVFGRSLVVHAGADDLKSQPSGDAGPRAAVGVIGIANPKMNGTPKTAAKSHVKTNR